MVQEDKNRQDTPQAMTNITAPAKTMARKIVMSLMPSLMTRLGMTNRMGGVVTMTMVGRYSKENTRINRLTRVESTASPIIRR